jgi:hypothetical protein
MPINAEELNYFKAKRDLAERLLEELNVVLTRRLPIMRTLISREDTIELISIALAFLGTKIELISEVEPGTFRKHVRDAKEILEKRSMQ